MLRIPKIDRNEPYYNRLYSLLYVTVNQSLWEYTMYDRRVPLAANIGESLSNKRHGWLTPFLYKAIRDFLWEDYRLPLKKQNNSAKMGVMRW